MMTIKFNSKAKAERCILAGAKTHRMMWEKYYSTDRDGVIQTYYLVFYSQK